MASEQFTMRMSKELKDKIIYYQPMEKEEYHRR